MAVFNFGSGFTSGSYGYTNGAFSSSTNFVNGVAYTRNILNLGGNGCNSGPNYCQDGYSFYVPCIKNITRGQNVCFQFYVADKANQDTLDLGDFGNSPNDCGLDGLTVQLTGPFGCAYGSYSYPDDIKSLQYDEFSEIGCEGFDGNIYRLDLGYLEYDPDKHTLREVPDDEVCSDEKGYNVDISGYVGEFFEGEKINIIASHSTTHLFVGWTTPEILSDLCSDFTLDDLIISTDRKWKYGEVIDQDIILYAVYRPRRQYIIKTDFENRHSFFMFMSDGRTIMLSDKVRDYAEILEDYHFVIECCPIIAKDKDGNEYTYNFKRWPDGDINRIKAFTATNDLFKNGELNLIAECFEEKIPLEKNQNIRNDVRHRQNRYRSCSPAVKTVENIVVDYVPSDYIVEYEGVMQSYGETDNNYIILSKDGYLVFDANVNEPSDLRLIMTIDTSNIKEPDIELPIIPAPELGNNSNGDIALLRCEAMDKFYENNFAWQEWQDEYRGKPNNNNTPNEDSDSDSDSESDVIEEEPPRISLGEVIVTNGNTEITASIYSKEDTELIFDFRGCEDGIFRITTTVDGLHIDNICVYERTIINKGLMELCLSPEDTLKFYTGVLNMNGVISVCGNTFGMDSVQIGLVNRLNPISIA